MTLAEAIAAGDLLAVARCYLAAGLSVIPVRADGSKAPARSGWRAYSERLPTEDELVAWFRPGEQLGVGVVPGPASGNLVVLDFECAAGVSAYSEWRAKLPDEFTAPLAACPIVRTPSGGRHVWVRLPRAIEGGKLSRYASGKTKVEVRGEGHQVLAPGCPAGCHSTGKTYGFEQWGWMA